MGRGRDPKASDTRILLELLLSRDRAVFGSEIADQLALSNERIRQKMGELEADGLVEVNQVSNRNLYRLTDDGLDVLAKNLRETID